MSWKSTGGNFGAGNISKGRQTFCDDAIKKSQKIPSPCRYDLDKKYRQPLGKIR
jgi:hypothetical protein